MVEAEGDVPVVVRGSTIVESLPGTSPAAIGSGAAGGLGVAGNLGTLNLSSCRDQCGCC